MSRPLIYLAGPYTKPDPSINVNHTVRVASMLMDAKVCWPVVPHLTHLWHTISPRPYEDWMALDLALLERCDGLVRLPGESPGADRELEHFVGLDRGPVYCMTHFAVTHAAPAIAGWIGRQFGGALTP